MILLAMDNMTGALLTTEEVTPDIAHELICPYCKGKVTYVRPVIFGAKPVLSRPYMRHSRFDCGGFDSWVDK